MKSMTVAGPFWAVTITNTVLQMETLGCEIKTTQPTDKEYGLRPSLHSSLTLRQE